MLHHTPDWRFPLGTFAVNVVGCLAAGLLAGLVVRRDWFVPDTRLFLFTGLLGGLRPSQPSARKPSTSCGGEHAVAVAYVALSVACGIGGLWLAISVTPGS